MLIDTNKIKKFCRKQDDCKGCPFNGRDRVCWVYDIVFATNRVTQSYRRMERVYDNK